MAVEAHAHQDRAELIVVSHGQGLMSVDSESQNVAEGDVIYIPPNAQHTVRNDSEQPLYLFVIKYDEVRDV
jgi:quercetin dioxygenase-like cupin family protein